MNKFKILILLAPLCGAFLQPAFAQKTKAQLTTEIGTTYPDNTTGQITPAGVRSYETDVLNSIMPNAPVVSGNLACFQGTTGLLQDCGVSLPLSLANGGLGASQSAATANQIPVYPGSGGAAIPTALTSLLNTVCGLAPATCASILGYSNIIWWGAVNNGTTDSTSAIQSAINSSCTTAAAVFFPGGSYLVSSTLNVTCSFISLRGSGSTASIIKRTTNYGDTFLFQGTAPARLQQLSFSGLGIQFSTVVPTNGANLHFVACDFVNINDVLLSDNFIGMQFDGSNNEIVSNATILASAGNSTGRIGMLIEKAPAGWSSVIGSGPNVTNLTIGSSPNSNPGFANDVLISGVDGAWFTNSYFGPAAQVNFAITNTDPTVSAVTGILVSNSWFDLGHLGIHFQMSGSSISNFGNVLLTGNIFIGGSQNDQGINIGGNAYGVNIVGNTFDGFTKQAINFAGSAFDFNVSNNKITNFNRGGGGFAAIEIIGSNITGTVSGNTIDQGLSTNSLGIWLSGTASKINVVGNTVTGCNKGVQVDLGVVSYVVTSNLISGNTTNLTDNGGAVNKLVANNLTT